MPRPARLPAPGAPLSARTAFIIHSGSGPQAGATARGAAFTHKDGRRPRAAEGEENG